jgi:hypothetical protein
MFQSKRILVVDIAPLIVLLLVVLLSTPILTNGAIGPSSYEYVEAKYQGWKDEICSLKERSIYEGVKGVDYFLWNIDLQNGGVSGEVSDIDDAKEECLERCTQSGNCQAASGTMTNWGRGPFECKLYYTGDKNIYHKPDPYPGYESYKYEFCLFKAINYYSDYNEADPNYYQLPLKKRS